jgi:hypothetical protein
VRSSSKSRQGRLAAFWLAKRTRRLVRPLPLGSIRETHGAATSTRIEEAFQSAVLAAGVWRWEEGARTYRLVRADGDA